MGIIFSRTGDGGVAFTHIHTGRWWQPIQPTGTPQSNRTWSNSSNVNQCVINGVKDELFYWPTPPIPNAATTVIHSNNYTFTSPTVYMHWKSLWTEVYGPSGPPLGAVPQSTSTIFDTIIPYDPEELSSLALGANSPWLRVTFSDFNRCSNQTWRGLTTATFTHSGFMQVVTDTMTISRFALTRTITHQGEEITLSNDPCNPYLNWPVRMWDIIPEWGHCQALGIVDPPVALRPQPILAPQPTRIRPTSESAVPASTRMDAFVPVPATPEPTAPPGPPHRPDSNDNTQIRPQPNVLTSSSNFDSGPNDEPYIPQDPQAQFEADQLAESAGPNVNSNVEPSFQRERSRTLQLEQSNSHDFETQFRASSVIPITSAVDFSGSSSPNQHLSSAVIGLGSSTGTSSTRPSGDNNLDHSPEQGLGADSPSQDLGAAIASVMGLTASQIVGAQSGTIILSTEEVEVSHTTRNGTTDAARTQYDAIATGTIVQSNSASKLCRLLTSPRVMGFLVGLFMKAAW